MENFNQYQKDQHAKQIEINKKILPRVISLAMKKELYININSKTQCISIFDTEFKFSKTSYFEGELINYSDKKDTLILTELYNEIKKL